MPKTTPADDQEFATGGVVPGPRPVVLEPGEEILPLADDADAGALAALEQENYRRAHGEPSPIIEPVTEE